MEYATYLHMKTASRNQQTLLERWGKEERGNGNIMER
jgi:hypothetical protein